MFVMTKLFSLLTLLIFSLTLSAKTVPVRWKVKDTKIDGNVQDWNRNVSYYDADTKVRYGIRNDSNNLYLAFAISDKMIQTKMAAAGMVLKFKYKNEEKLKPVIFIKPFLKKGNRPGRGGKRSVDERRAAYRLNLPPVELEGFAKCNGNIYSMKHEKAITYGFDWDSTEVMIMELKIPFTELYGKDFQFDQLTKAVMAINISIKGLEIPENSGQGQGMGSGGGRQGGHPGGGGMRPQGTAPSQQQRMKMFENQFFKRKFTFALKPE
jgi:hypothetical protein